MPLTSLPETDGGPPAGPLTRVRGEDAIRAGILVALGGEAGRFRVVVRPLWGNRFRVNVVTGADPTAVRIPHGHFLAADDRGTVTEARPPIPRWYSTMTPTFRVRYNRKHQGGQQRPADVESADVRAELEHIPGQLPPGAYILSVEDLDARRDVHWSRWPAAFRPGFGG